METNNQLLRQKIIATNKLDKMSSQSSVAINEFGQTYTMQSLPLNHADTPATSTPLATILAKRYKYQKITASQATANKFENFVMPSIKKFDESKVINKVLTASFQVPDVSSIRMHSTTRSTDKLSMTSSSTQSEIYKTAMIFNAKSKTGNRMPVDYLNLTDEMYATAISNSDPSSYVTFSGKSSERKSTGKPSTLSTAKTFTNDKNKSEPVNKSSSEDNPSKEESSGNNSAFETSKRLLEAEHYIRKVREILKSVEAKLVELEAKLLEEREQVEKGLLQVQDLESRKRLVEDVRRMLDVQSTVSRLRTKSVIVKNGLRDYEKRQQRLLECERKIQEQWQIFDQEYERDGQEMRDQIRCFEEMKKFGIPLECEKDAIDLHMDEKLRMWSESLDEKTLESIVNAEN